MSTAIAPESRRVALARPSFDESEERAAAEAIRSGWVTQGPRVAEFESAFATAVGAEQAVATSSCTTALFLSLHASGVGPGDEVIVPSLSFIATANAVVQVGATPVFADVDPRTTNLDPESTAAAITPRTRAILPVHQLGVPLDLAPFEAMAGSRDLLLVEDAACAVGSRVGGRPVGASPHLACFSFHPRKVLVTGEGGMITLPDAAMAERLRRLRHHGMSVSDLERHRSNTPVLESYDEVGFNFRLSDLHAALGLAQLAKLPRLLKRRREVGARYDAALADCEHVSLFRPVGDAEPNLQSYILRLRGPLADRRDEVMTTLQQRGVASRRGVLAIHREPAYQGRAAGMALPQTEALADETLLLPCHAELSNEDIEYVIASFLAALAEVAA